MASRSRLRPLVLAALATLVFALAMLTDTGLSGHRAPEPSLAEPLIDVASGEVRPLPLTPEATLAVEALREELSQILGTGQWPATQWSVLVVSLDQGDTLFARNPHQLLAPASNMKLFTTAAALWYLGSGFRYRTFLLAGGEVEAGLLDGDLVLYGTGDPSISSRFYATRTQIWERLALQLERAGIREIRGDVVGDASFFTGPTRPPGWEEKDLSDWFAAPISALSFNENVVTLRVAAGSSGIAPAVHTIPEESAAPIENHGLTVSTRPRPRLAIYRDVPSGPIQVVGQIRSGSRDVWRRMTVTDPALEAAHTLKAVLERRGIIIRGEARSSYRPEASQLTQRELWAPEMTEEAAPTILASHQSRPLFDLLEVVNKQSNNLYAEMVLQTLGRIVVGDGSFKGGARAVQRFLVEEVGLAPDAIFQEDGSGLSAVNRASAFAFVALLDHMAQTELWTPYWKSLPVAGNRRELGRMYRTAAAGNLRAKTGTIDRVSALTGMVQSARGERLLFSILANDVRSNSATKRVENRIGETLASFSRTFSSDTTRARVLAQWQPEGSEPGALPGVFFHEVQRGENFTVIARRYGVGLELLMRANPGIRPTQLQAGQVLEVPREGG